ncbi:PaaI family thioesterase [Leisingera caerulea]|uniref:PaaI family thioesterase n=1 Tax=Leisingera caerulea TaxID=506591 RepID=UPI000428D432|nr:PaaI family thioesterase [Leisingera caerulea]
MAAGDLIKDETGTQRLIGYVIDVGQPDKRARCTLSVTDHHLNRHNVLHGGIVTTMLDSAMGATASLSVDPSGRAPFLTVSLTTQFVAAATEKSKLIATGEAVGGGRSLLFVDGELRDGSGRLIATATGVFKRVPADKLDAPKGSDG